jgi:SNF2 family DNA or RNA helicase
MSLDDLDFDLFLDSLDDLQAAGIDVKWPADLVSADLERRLVVGEGTSAPGDAMPVVNDIDSLLKVNWEFLLEGTPLSSDELRVLSEAKRPVVPLRGRWVRLTASERQRLREPAPTLSSTDLLAAALGGGLDGSLVSGAATDDGSLFGRVATADEGELIDVRAVGRPAALIDRLLEIADGRLENEPEGLEATLRPYQRQGLAWMADLAAFGCGGCLADDMGLGKTIQLLALHQLRGAKTLVICPTSLMANWERETGRFLPAAAVRRYHGPNRSLDDLAPHQLVVTTYGVLRSDAEKLAAVGWDLCVADEAQYAKNPRSRTARALRKIPAASRIALTGTPVENRLTELWSIIDWVMPGLLGPLAAFRTNTAVPIERDDNQIVAKRLSNLLKPFVLRRVKTDPEIAPELPAKTESDVVVPLTAEQVSLYQATTSEALLDLAENDGMVRQGLILKLLTALKQITNHPAQYLGESEPLAGRSGKLDALDDLLDRAHANGESTLVFTQYVRMGQLLVDHLRARGVEVDLLHGGQSIANRQVLVDRMQSGDLPVLILSLKAGGTGLNLTRATQVIHYDRWWNPAVEDQATDRAYRIGQDKPVMVHRLVTEGTVEDRVAELLREKRRLADRVVGSGESWIGQLDNDELADLVQLADHDGHHEAGNEQTATPGSSM